MKAEHDTHGFLRQTQFLANMFGISIFELLMGATYLNDSDMRRILLLAAAQ